jgi:hypothetical protein
MTIGLMSLFRNSEHRLRKYFQQVLELRTQLKIRGDDLALISIYGDCVDHTAAVLKSFGEKHRFMHTIREVNHGGPEYGSTEAPERLKALTHVLNSGLEALSERDSALIYVESDLLWDASTWINLLGDLEPGYDVIAPLIFAGEYFYDVWGFRHLNGERFSPRWKGHGDGELFEVGSVGSGFVMRGEVARTCRVQNDYALVGWSDDVRKHGYRIWVDPTERITHPA